MNRFRFVGCVTTTITAALLCLSTARVHAMTVVWSTDSSTALALPGGTTGLPVGDLIELGNFNGMSDADIAGLGNNPSAVQGAFHLLATGHIGDLTDPTAAGSFYESTTAPGAGWTGTQVYLVAFDAPTVALASGVIVATGPLAYIEHQDRWIFPSDGTGIIVIQLSQVSPANVLIGTYFTGTFDDSSGPNWFGRGVNAIAMVPEPSSIALVGIGLLGILGLIRRRS